MVGLYLASTEAYSGKTGITLGIGLDLKEKGLKVGYMKPVGNLPLKKGKLLTDKDAYYVWTILKTSDPIEYIAPVVITRGVMQEYLEMDLDQSLQEIEKAYEVVSEGKDVVILEGGADLNEGRIFGVSGDQLIKLFGLRVILIVKFRSEFVVDDILFVRESVGDRLVGVVFNWVPRSQRHVVDMIVRYLERHGLQTIGVLPEDKVLMSVTIAELAEHLDGKILTAEEQRDELVESFMVGAMGQEKALRFFQRVTNKAVITGGDRADVQLAALETPTKCLILTGGLQPSPIVMARAEELQVPMILVETDTLTAVEKTDELVGKVRVHQPQKVARVRELMKVHMDFSALYEILEVP
jgi:hypothetical protein